MGVSVDTFEGCDGGVLPRRFRFDERKIDVADNLDWWLGAGYCYFKVRSADGSMYILRLDEALHQWELTMFERAPPPELGGLASDR